MLQINGLGRIKAVLRGAFEGNYKDIEIVVNASAPIETLIQSNQI